MVIVIVLYCYCCPPEMMCSEWLWKWNWAGLAFTLPVTLPEPVMMEVIWAVFLSPARPQSSRTVDEALLFNFVFVSQHCIAKFTALMLQTGHVHLHNSQF